MKSIIVLALVMFCNVAIAEEVIVKIAPNNVEIQEVYYKDKAGQEPIIVERQSYGQNRVDRELASANTNISAIEKQTAEDYKANALKAFKDHKTKLTKIQTEMDKEIG